MKTKEKYHHKNQLGKIMNIIKMTLVVSSLFFSTTGWVAADETSPALESQSIPYYDSVAVELGTMGYTGIRLLSTMNPNRLVAFDPEGSEVYLNMDPESGFIDSSEYPHWADR